MKELAIYFTNVKALEKIDEALRWVDASKVDPIIRPTLLTNDTNLGDYLVNLQSLPYVNAIRESGIEFSRLYFGQEFCQNLIPGPNEVEQSYYYARQFGFEYTYVTGGYLTEVGLDKVRRNLEKLRELDPTLEVVFNDWGVLRILQREFPEFKRCMGRLLDKQTRLALFVFPRYELPILKDELQTPIDEIRENQIHARADVSLNNNAYNKALRDWGVKNVGMDIVPQGIVRPDDGWQMDLDMYFPWAFVSAGRSCETAGTVDPYRNYQVTDSPCSRPCQRYNCTPELKSCQMSMMRRGTTLFASTISYAGPYFDGTAVYERLVYEPYIPL